MNLRKASTVAFTIILTAACFAPLFGNIDNINGDIRSIDRITPVSGDGYIWINDVNGLKAIGTGGTNPIDGDYILGSDITFAPEDAVGTQITMTITISGNVLKVSIPSAVSGVAFLDSVRVILTVGSASFDYDPTREYVLAVGGNDGTNDFAYSIVVPKDYVPSNTIEFTSNGNFIPIGTSSVPFSGTFNGNGYEIKGMNIAMYSNNAAISAGMFAYVSGGNISNLIMADGKTTVISTYQNTALDPNVVYAGNIVGSVVNATNFIIENCLSSNDITVAAATDVSQSIRKNVNIGGLIGYAGPTSTNDLMIKDCVNAGNVTGLFHSESKYIGEKYAYSGGIIGCSNSRMTMTDCNNTGAIRTSFNAVSVSIGGTPRPNSYIGGLTGFIGVDKQTTQSFTRCSNSGDVSSAIMSSTLFSTTGYSVYANQYIAGILGFTSPLAVTKFDGCYNNGKVNGMVTVMTSFGQTYYSLYVGGLCNVNGASITADAGIDMNDCYNTGDITAVSRAALSIEPVLSGYVGVGGLLGTASSGSRAVSCYNEGDVTAISKINFTRDTTHPTYAGGLMGAAYWSGKMVTVQTSYNAGSITLISDRTVSTMNGSNQKLDQYIGGLVADAYSLSVTDSNNIGRITFDSVSDISVGNASVSSSVYIGGIAGRAYNNATITRSYNEGDMGVSNVTSISMTGNNRLEDYTTVGGILGRNEMYTAKITDCYNRGNISASFDSDSVSPGDIGDVLSVGGILGYSGLEKGETAFDPISSVTNCYNVGKLTATSNNAVASAGGIIGTADNTGKIRGTISFSYFLENLVTSNGSLNNGLTGSGEVKTDTGYSGTTLKSGSRTSSQMRDRSTFFNTGENKGWDLTPGSGIWKINPQENEGHPYLNKERVTTYTVQLFTDSDDAYNIVEKGPSFGTEISMTKYFEFSVSLNDGYQGPVIVKKNGIEIKPSGKNYSVKGAAGDVIIVGVLGAKPVQKAMTYVVQTPSADNPEAYVIKPTGTYNFGADVPVGTDFTFSVKVKAGYNGPIAVNKNGSPMSGESDNFVVTGASANDIIAIDVSGAVIANSAFTVPNPVTDVANAYIITAVGGYGFNAMVPVGTDFTFTVKLDTGYEGTIVVKKNGMEIHMTSGVYAVSGSAGDAVAITVEGATRSMSTYYVVTSPLQTPVNAYIITPTVNYEFGQTIPVNTAFTFKIELADGHVGIVKVTCRGVIIHGNNGEYSVSGSAGEIVFVSISGALMPEEPSGSEDIPNSVGDGDRSYWWILLLVIIVTSVSIYLLYKDDKRKK